MNTQTSLGVSRSAAANEIMVVTCSATFKTLFRGKSLIVVAGPCRFLTQGAQLNARALGGEVCVTCLEGMVRIDHKTQSAQLEAGSQLRYDVWGLGLPTPAAPEATSWRDGVLVFRLQPLSAVVAEVNRYRTGHVMVLGEELAQRAVSGRVLLDHIDEALALIARAAGATEHPLPGGLVLLT